MARLLRPSLQDLQLVEAGFVDLPSEGNVERIDARGEHPKGRRYGFTIGFWRSSVRRAGPPVPKLDRGRPPPTAAQRIPTTGRARLAAPAPPRLSRAARCAPECAHALKAVANAVADRRIRRGSSLLRGRACAAPRSVPPIDIIAMNQTRQPWDVSTALQDVSKRPKTSLVPRSAFSLSPVPDFIAHPVDETARTFLRRFRTFYRRLETSQRVAGSSWVRRVTQNVWAPDFTP